LFSKVSGTLISRGGPGAERAGQKREVPSILAKKVNLFSHHRRQRKHKEQKKRQKRALIKLLKRLIGAYPKQEPRRLAAQASPNFASQQEL
jgi:hypothetical protein